MDLCEICKENVGITVSTTIGGYIVVICTCCRRDFHKFVFENKMLRKHEIKKAKIEARITCGDVDAISEIDWLFGQRLEMYYIVQEWFEIQKELHAEAREERREE